MHRDLVKNEIVETHWGKFFDDVFESRQRGDYTPMVIFDPDQVEEFLRHTEGFIEEMEKLINRF